MFASIDLVNEGMICMIWKSLEVVSFGRPFWIAAEYMFRFLLAVGAIIEGKVFSPIGEDNLKTRKRMKGRSLT